MDCQAFASNPLLGIVRMQTTIRLAVPADAAAVTDCVCRAFIDYIAVIGQQPQPMLDDYQALIRRNRVYIAVADTDLAGVLVVEHSEHAFSIETLATHPAFQGAGIGKKLIAWAERLAQEHHVHAVTLSTNRLMHRTREIYRHLGFVEYDQAIVNGYDRILMRKTIG